MFYLRYFAPLPRLPTLASCNPDRYYRRRDRVGHGWRRERSGDVTLL